MKKKISIFMTAIMAFAIVLSGCGKQNETTLSAEDADVYGKVVSIDGNTVSVNVVTMPEMTMPETGTGADGQIDMSEMPTGEDGQNPQGTQGGGQEMPPEMPTGEGGQNQQGGQNPQGTQGGGQEMPPEMPTGEGGQIDMSEIPTGEGGQIDMSEMPTGEDGQIDMSEMPEIQGGGGFGLTESGETGTVTIKDTSVMYKVENGEETVATLDDIEEGKILKITFDESGKISKIGIYNENEVFMNGQGGRGAGGGMGSAPSEYDAVKKIDSDTKIKGDTIDSTGTDENNIWISDGTVSIDKATFTRTSSDSTGGDNSSFYGVGAAILATDGTVDITNSKITTDAAGGAGVFAYGSAVVSVSDTTISTKQNTSGGIHAAGGGTLYAKNLTVETDGASSAAIRSDRGGGTMTVDGGAYTSNGSGSPAIYCTADISAKGCTLTATDSEAICIEGKNSLRLYDCILTGNMPDQDGNDSTWTVIVYQSMSGDAEIGQGTFQMSGGKLVSQNGGLFYTTNTASSIILENVSIEAAADSEYLLACLGNNNQRGWGTVGKNGADCTFTAIAQTLSGKVLWDSVSNLDLYLTQKSTFTGSVIQDEEYAGEGGNGYASVYIDSNSKWIVDGDSTVTNLFCAGTIVDSNGKTVSITGTDGTTFVKGNSSFSITVTSFSNEADTSGAGVPSAWN